MFHLLDVSPCVEVLKMSLFEHITPVPGSSGFPYIESWIASFPWFSRIFTSPQHFSPWTSHFSPWTNPPHGSRIDDPGAPGTLRQLGPQRPERLRQLQQLHGLRRLREGGEPSGHQDVQQGDGTPWTSDLCPKQGDFKGTTWGFKGKSGELREES